MTKSRYARSAKLMNFKYNDDAIIQNLRDAGCDEDKINAFIKDIWEDKISDGLKLLSTHRRSLLDHLHEKQKQIDCLDYLVYQFERQS